MLSREDASHGARCVCHDTSFSDKTRQCCLARRRLLGSLALEPTKAAEGATFLSKVLAIAHATMTKIATFVMFWTMLAHFGPIPGLPPQQSQNKSLKPPNSGCFDRIGTRHVIKKNTLQDQNFVFFLVLFWAQTLSFFSCFVRIGTGAYSIETLFGEF